jgi:hypothetical protein
MRRNRLHALGVAAVAAVVLVAIAVAQSAFGRSVLRDSGFEGGDERYTELAFAQPTKVPEWLTEYRPKLDLPVAIHNGEGRPRTYRWTATVRHGRRTKVLDRGTVALARDGRATIDPHVKFSCRSGRVRVEVAVDRPKQAIGAWIRCPGTPPEESRDG